jgi:hypothetical protein
VSVIWLILYRITDSSSKGKGVESIALLNFTFYLIIRLLYYCYSISILLLLYIVTLFNKYKRQILIQGYPISIRCSMMIIYLYLYFNANVYPNNLLLYINQLFIVIQTPSKLYVFMLPMLSQFFQKHRTFHPYIINIYFESSCGYCC